jgi:hypothetical protein
MKPLDRYTLLMTAARDHARQGEWEIARENAREAVRIAAMRHHLHTPEVPWLALFTWASDCEAVACNQIYRRKMGGRYAREAT